MRVLTPPASAAVLALARAGRGARARTLRRRSTRRTGPGQDDMTWNDYKPLPGHGLLGPGIQPTVKKWKVALVARRLPGQALHVTQPPGSTVFGTPTAEAHDIPRADVARSTATSSTSRSRSTTSRP